MWLLSISLKMFYIESLEVFLTIISSRMSYAALNERFHSLRGQTKTCTNKLWAAAK